MQSWHPSVLPATLCAGMGFAAGPLTYEYVDLWSRHTTWGGGPLPVAESLVYIPAGVTVLLDVSPPPLAALVVEGNLVFDERVAALELAVKYILIKGGNLSIGTQVGRLPAGLHTCYIQPVIC